MSLLSTENIDLDVHDIHASDPEPPHRHYDVRFLPVPDDFPLKGMDLAAGPGRMDLAPRRSTIHKRTVFTPIIRQNIVFRVSLQDHY